VDGFLSGKEIRESLKVRDWQKAQEQVREWEIEDRRTQRQQTRLTIATAHQKFMADAEARKLNQATLYKYRLLFRHLEKFAETCKLEFLDQLDLDTLATFRASWTEGPRTTLRANIRETPVVPLINEQGEKEKGRDEWHFSWCSFLGGFGWRGTERRRAKRAAAQWSGSQSGCRLPAGFGF
jgi:hypothetical protein